MRAQTFLVILQLAMAFCRFFPTAGKEEVESYYDSYEFLKIWPNSSLVIL